MSAKYPQVILTSIQPFGPAIPPQPLGRTLVAIPDLVRLAIAMAYRGQSATRGKRPTWLRAASDIRLVDIQGGEETVLTFQAPTLADATPEVFEQAEFAWATRPAPQDTGFDLLGDVLNDVSQRNAESERFDPRLLAAIWATHAIVDRDFPEIKFVTTRFGAPRPACLNSTTTASAKALHDTTPRPQAAIVVGKLDMIRDSTQTFALMMHDGQEIRCVMVDDAVETLAPLFNQQVAVSGRAIFRPSGHVLRLEADAVRAAAASDQHFARIPRPNARRFDLRRVLREQSHKRGVAAILGTWPGDETDEHIQASLQDPH